jgi:16S rRNA (cytidine1402-2'-O)-methyltransferase
MTSGTLYLVPTPLDFGSTHTPPLTQTLPEHTIEVASSLGLWICENAKSTRAFLKRVNEVRALRLPIQEHNMLELPHQVHKKGDHKGEFNPKELLKPLLEGHHMGLVSEAGMPAIADPGASVVRAAHLMGISVAPLVGPVSLMLALASSGMNGQNFSFVGYLPQAQESKIERLKYLDQWIKKSGQTQIFIETPYRNESLLRSMLEVLHPQTRLALACGLCGPKQWIESHQIEKWKTFKTLPPLGEPCVFLLGS